MEWRKRRPGPGDLCRVYTDPVYHYGICSGKNRFIAFGNPPLPEHMQPAEDVRVAETDLNGFSLGEPVECANVTDADGAAPAETVLARARMAIGKGGYDLLRNNCEHFATACVFGQGTCSQTEALAKLIRLVPRADIYILKLPDYGEELLTGYAPRDAELSACRIPMQRRQKYWAWKLVEHAAKRSLGIRLADSTPKRDENGKWTADGVCFSLSHSSSFVMSGVSTIPVGVDVEEKLFTAKKETVLRNILNEGEQVPESITPEQLRTLWCEKEALYKAFGTGAYRPQEQDTRMNAPALRAGVFQTEGVSASFAAASEIPQFLKLFAASEWNGSIRSRLFHRMAGCEEFYNL